MPILLPRVKQTWLDEYISPFLLAPIPARHVSSSKFGCRDKFISVDIEKEVPGDGLINGPVLVLRDGGSPRVGFGTTTTTASRRAL